jgi:hypothetical protein
MQKLKQPIVLGLILTFGFLIVVASVVHPRWSEIGNLKLNELGDFLAGISSTLAFLWLIIAVLLQRQELQAQREELRQSREALKAQAAELKRTADQQKIQVEIMGAQLNDIKTERQIRDSSHFARSFCGDLIGALSQLDFPGNGAEVSYPNGTVRIFALASDPITPSYEANSFRTVLDRISAQLARDRRHAEDRKNVTQQQGSIHRSHYDAIARIHEICANATRVPSQLALIDRFDPSMKNVIEVIEQHAQAMLNALRPR